MIFKCWHCGYEWVTDNENLNICDNCGGEGVRLDKFK